MIGLTLTDNVAHASSFSVTTTTDGGPGSLRDAIDQANANPGPDTINVPAGIYTLAILGRDEDANLTGDLDITGATTITGAGAGLTIIDADGIDRAFDVIGGPTVLQGLTITSGAPAVVIAASGGNVRGQDSADLTIQDSIVSNGNASYGGGVFADKGVLNIVRTEVVGNSVTGVIGQTVFSGIGGAIYKGGGSMVLTDSLVADNHADFNSNAIIYVTAALTVTNSTINDNTAQGYMVLVEAQQSANFAIGLNHVTIANNTTATSVGAGLTVNLISPAVMPVTVTGSLFVNNVGSGATQRNCALLGNGGPAITSGGNNLSDDTTCTAFTQPGDLNNNQSTSLGALANNGGPTRTLALVAGSSALDAAGACGAVTATDQRGVSRPQGAACDIGAFEADVVVTPTTEAPTTEAPTTEAPTTAAPTTQAPTTAPTTSLGSGVVGATTVPPAVTAPPETVPGFDGGQLPVTGGDHSGGLWLALLACSLGGLLVLTARRLAR